MRKWIYLVALIFALALPVSLFAGMGYVSAKSSDVDIKLFGSEEFMPTFIYNADFNSDSEWTDFIGREDGLEQQFAIRNQFRMGWLILGNKWKGMFILEDDVNATKTSIDRIVDTGSDSSDFGLEKLDFSYTFNKYFTLEMGWNGRALDIKTGGLVYTDDHPFFGFKGAGKNWKYEILALFIRNDATKSLADKDLKWLADIGAIPKAARLAGYSLRKTETLNRGFSGHQDDLFAYTAKLYYTFGTQYGKLTVAPFFAFQDNQITRAQSYYIGTELFGKLGMIIPRFEIVYVGGDQDGVTLANGKTKNLDIDAWAGFLSFEFDINKAFKPYIGGWYISGDDDANDGDANDFQGITGIQKFTPTFGMGYGDALSDTNLRAGTVLYSINPILTGLIQGLGNGGGYGGIGGAGRVATPGVIFVGLGFKGSLSDFVKGLSYKIQGYYMEYEDTGGIEDYLNAKYGTAGTKNAIDVDDEMGWGTTFMLKLVLDKHFSITNTTTIFVPGDGIEDINATWNGKKWVSDYDDTMIVTTFNFKWAW